MRRQTEASCELRGVTYGGMEPSSLIHGQESVTVDPFNADDPLRNRKELQDTWVRQTACFDDQWNDVCVFLPLLTYSGTRRCSTVRTRSALCCSATRSTIFSFISRYVTSLLWSAFSGDKSEL